MTTTSQASEDGRATLFLSYARSDRAVAEKLCAALRQAGFEVWWDALIEGGAQFAGSIADALDRADAVLVLWSRQSVSSDWVRDEAATGRDRHRLVPLTLDDAALPLGFRQYQTIDLRRWNGRPDAPEIAAIVRAVAAFGGVSLPPAAPPRRALSRRAVVLAGAGTAVLAASGGVFWAFRENLADGPEDAGGIVVLPFRNLSADPAQAYFAEGLTEEVRSALRRIPALKVVAATSSDAAGESRDDAPTIARKLGVAFLLEGSVRRAADRVRIAVDLTEGASGFSRWSDSIDRPIADVFAVESEIAALVSKAISARMAPARSPPGGTVNVTAYEHFLRGRALFNLGKDEATDRAALAELDRAVAIDAGFALAHAARSRAISAIAAEYAPADQLPALQEQAIGAARRAIALAPDLAEGQLAMGFVLFSGRLEIARARPFYDRAYALAGGNADVILLYALYCSRAGRAEDAARAIAQALALDPLNARTHRAAGSIAFAARRYQAALAPLRRAIELNPQLSNAHVLTGYCLMALGQDAAALHEFEAEPHATFRLAGLAIVHAKLGRRSEAKRYFGQLVQEYGDRALYQQAEVLAQWGDRAGALAALDRAWTVRDAGLIYLATDPLLDPVRDTPDMRRLLKGMEFG